MKTILKPFSTLIVLCASLLAGSAQQYQPVALLTGGTQNISASATSNYTATVNVRGADYVGVYGSFKMLGAGTDDVVVTFAKSADGSNFESTPSISITNSANGTNVVKWFSAQSVVGVHSLQLSSVVNGVSQAMTNLTITVGVKNFFR